MELNAFSNSTDITISGRSFAVKKCDIRADDLVADVIQTSEAVRRMEQAFSDRLARELADSVDQCLSQPELPVSIIEFPEPGPIQFRVTAYYGVYF